MREGAIRALVVGAAFAGAVIAARSCGATPTGAPDPGRTTTAGEVDAPARGAGRVAVERARDRPAPAPGARSSDASAGGRVVLFSPWGGASPGQIGREVPAEGNPMGPMSFAVDGRGRMHVLDQVHGRLARFGADGSFEGATPVAATAQDVAVADDGSVAVLDRFGSASVDVLGPDGTKRASFPLEGTGIDDAGAVTGVFVDGDRVYAERAHGPLVYIGSTSGVAADPREQIPGRPSRDKLSYLRAGLIDAAAGRVYVTSTERATGDHRFTRELRLGAPVHTIELLDSDERGTIYFAAEIAPAPGDAAILLTCLEPVGGAPIGSAVLPASTLPDESFRDLQVLAGGGVVLARRTDAGVSYERYDCQ